MTLVFQDSFVSTTTTALTSHTPDTGTSWVEQFNDTSGAAVINNNAADDARASANAVNAAIVMITNPAPTEADVDVQLVTKDFASGGTGPFGVVARYQDDDNYLALGTVIKFLNPDMFLVECIEGTRTAIASYDAGTDDGHAIKLEVVGTNARAYMDTGSGFFALGVAIPVADDVVGDAGMFWGNALHVATYDIINNKLVESFQLDEFASAGGGGWTGTINGVTNPTHVNGIAVADITSINGVA